MTTSDDRPHRSGGAWLLEDATAGDVFTPRAAHRRASADRADGRRVRRQAKCCRRSIGSSRRTGRWRARWCSAAASSACSASTCPRRTAASISTRSSSLVVGEAIGRVGVVRHDVRRAGQPRDHCRSSVRHRGAEAAVPAAARHRRDGRRLRAQRVGLGLRRARRQDARRRGSPTAASCSTARRCGSPTAASPTSSSSSPRSTASSSPPSSSSAAFPGVSTRQGRAQDGPARLVDDAAHPAGRAGAGRATCSARSARATRSRSTC